ncbi:MAG: hypothetical protein ABJN40_05790 [Sneathiella sp.]
METSLKLLPLAREAVVVGGAAGETVFRAKRQLCAIPHHAAALIRHQGRRSQMIRMNVSYTLPVIGHQLHCTGYHQAVEAIVREDNLVRSPRRQLKLTQRHPG